MNLVDRFEFLPDLVNGDSDLLRRGQFLRLDFLVEIGAEPFRISVEAGHITLIRGPALLRSHCFSIAAGEDAWLAHWSEPPAPGWHDLFAMTKSGAAHIKGNLQPLMANLQYFKDVLAAPRFSG
ncbi:MAG TPA: hypothetical protein QGF63_06260 [Alphaproteobacteria bacterium]|nr:hypothetical protein [Alphaproteobacteria bacterium]MDP6270280.1 hypothetical protein [Alphaproteobacteria bacterium]MDP7164275.1 hypothetical protein [Alphaproteobacteria bacterium]MDP7428733.1 hypothetical protein [Alphaproteobacteria bacterium]HJM49438.1 hypothetical protein [Alphaproteobacteria bacterium]